MTTPTKCACSDATVHSLRPSSERKEYSAISDCLGVEKLLRMHFSEFFLRFLSKAVGGVSEKYILAPIAISVILYKVQRVTDVSSYNNVRDIPGVIRDDL